MINYIDIKEYIYIIITKQIKILKGKYMNSEYNEELLEPLKYYNEHLRDNFKSAVKDYFQNLVEESGVDIEKNHELMKQYEDVSNRLNHLKSNYRLCSLLKKLLFGVTGVCLFLIGKEFFQDSTNVEMTGIYLVILVFAMGIYFLWTKPKLNELDQILNNLDETLNHLRENGYEGMKALNNLFHSQMTAELIKKTIPFIHLDPAFHIKRYEQLVKNYNFLEKDDINHSTLDIASGDILGNPFVFIKRLVHEIGEYTYEGSLNISYLEHYKDSDGKSCTRRVHETLHAEIKKPGPYYSDTVSLVYGNEAAPDLIFHRDKGSKGGVTGFFNKARLKRKVSKIRNRTRQSVKQGETFQGMANEEFDALFNAMDRNNEVQPRLLFTPLAQKNYLDIFEHSPYGDDFSFYKENKINQIEAENSQNWDFDTSPSHYWSFSFAEIRENFISFNCNYFEHMYFSFLPLLAIPLYQQMMSTDYIYGNSYNYNYNDYTTEMIANKMASALFTPEEADIRDNVRTLLKTSHYERQEKSEIVQVDAYSYKTIKRVDYVPVRAGNDKVYDVPVEWEEYIPVTKREYIEVAGVDSPSDKFETIKELDYYQCSEANRDRTFAYGHYLAGKIYGDNEPLSDLLEKIYKGYVGGQNG